MSMANGKLTVIKYSLAKTKRPISPGAEKWLGKPIPCLDHGFVYLVDYLGNDLSVEQAARVSYGGGTRKVSETRGLIRYLKRNDHTTPFEMVELKFHAKMPIFVARQWVRHRTASINEYSARYSILDKEFYLPEPEILSEQSKNNKQGRGEVVSSAQAEEIRRLLLDEASGAYGLYEQLLNEDGDGNPKDLAKPKLARELARMGLTLNYYTQWYWKINLHNFMHFIKLRVHPHAQYEIRVFAEAMSKIAKQAFPIAWEAFEDYELNAEKFTSPELAILVKMLGNKIKFTPDEVIELAVASGMDNKREQYEMVKKLKLLGIIS